MKRSYAIALFGALLSMSAASASSGPKWVSVPVLHAFAPVGFDTNDNTEVIVSGYLPNLCYKSPKAEEKAQGKDVTINMKALKSDSAICPQLIVPFLEPVSLGVMDRGKYDVTVNTGLPTETKTDISVVESSSPALDDYVYASVKYVERIPGVRKVLLKGENPSTCYELDEVKFISNGKDTYSILPTLKRVSEFCPEVLVPFAYEIDVPTELAAKTVLLHVRAMNGKSVNALFEN